MSSTLKPTLSKSPLALRMPLMELASCGRPTHRLKPLREALPLSAPSLTFAALLLVWLTVPLQQGDRTGGAADPSTGVHLLALVFELFEQRRKTNAELQQPLASIPYIRLFHDICNKLSLTTLTVCIPKSSVDLSVSETPHHS